MGGLQTYNRQPTTYNKARKIKSSIFSCGWSLLVSRWWEYQIPQRTGDVAGLSVQRIVVEVDERKRIAFDDAAARLRMPWNCHVFHNEIDADKRVPKERADLLEERAVVRMHIVAHVGIARADAAADFLAQRDKCALHGHALPCEALTDKL